MCWSQGDQRRSRAQFCAPFDPKLDATMVAVAFVPPGTFALTPLQFAGMATGGLFLSGLCFVWLVLAERPDDAATGPEAETPAGTAPSRKSLCRSDPSPRPPMHPPVATRGDGRERWSYPSAPWR